MNRNDTFECICLPDLYTGNACETGKFNKCCFLKLHAERILDSVLLKYLICDTVCSNIIVTQSNQS